MTPPSVIGTPTSGNDSTNTQNHVITLPTGIQVGELLKVKVIQDGTLTMTWPAGWTQIVIQAGTGITLEVRCRIADGSEGASITVTTATNEALSWQAERITDWYGSDLTNSVVAGTPATGSSANPDPPSVTAPWGSDDNLFEVVMGWGTSVSNISAYPSNYSSNQLTDDDANANIAGIASATRSLTADSDDPGTATLSVSDNWVAVSLVIRPASSSAIDLTVQDSTHGHGADSIALTVSSHLAVTDATHEQVSDSIALTADAFLAVSDATHEQAADAITLAVTAYLAVTDSTHEHIADAGMLTADAYLAITDAAHEQAADPIALASTSYLSIQDPTHDLVVDGIMLSTEGSTSLTVQDVSHLHVAGAIDLTAVSYLTVADGNHQHAVDSIDLTLSGSLIVQDALHAHTTDLISLTTTSVLEIDAARHMHSSDQLVLVAEGQAGGLVIHATRREAQLFPDWDEPLEGIAVQRRNRKPLGF